jgi:hypothetical protein
MDARWLRPLGIGEVIDAALKIYRARFGTMLRAVAVVVVPVQLVNILVVLSLPETTTSTTTTDGFTTTSSTVGSGAAIAAFLVLQIVTILSGLLATAACLKVVSDAYLGTVTDWRESLKFGMSKFPSVLWIGILSILGVGLGFIFCIVPGVWLYIAWCVAIPALLVEGARGTKALSRSFKLVRNRWWPTFAVLLIAGLITAAVTFGLTIFTVPLLLSGASFTTTQVTSAIANTIAAVLTTPFSAAVTALIYFELRVRKEGFDLALMAQRVGVEPPAGGFAPAPMQPWDPPPGQPWGQPPPPGAWMPPPGAWTPAPDAPQAPWADPPPPPPSASPAPPPPPSSSPWAAIPPDPEPPPAPSEPPRVEPPHVEPPPGEPPPDPPREG